jgi:uncharacterized protein YejL (UPF0352 family)
VSPPELPPDRPPDGDQDGATFPPRPTSDPVEQILSRSSTVLQEVRANADSAMLAITATVTDLLGPLVSAADRVVAAASMDDRDSCRRSLEELSALGDSLPGQFAELAESFDLTQRAIAEQLDDERRRLERGFTSRRR